MQTAGTDFPAVEASALTRKTSNGNCPPKAPNHSVGSRRLAAEHEKYVVLNPSRNLSQRSQTGEVEIVELSVPLLKNNLAGPKIKAKRTGNEKLRNSMGVKGPP